MSRKKPQQFKGVSVGLPPRERVCEHFGRRIARQVREANHQNEHRPTKKR